MVVVRCCYDVAWFWHYFCVFLYDVCIVFVMFVHVLHCFDMTFAWFWNGLNMIVAWFCMFLHCVPMMLASFSMILI